MNEKKEIIVSKEYYEERQKEYRRLLDVERPKVLDDLNAARAMGDLSENADYDAARNKQAEIEARITELEFLLDNAKIIESEGKGKTINISSIVTFKEVASGEISKVKIVSSVESDTISDPLNLKVSNECALGKALIGKKAGDKITVKAVTPYEIEILEVNNK